MMKRFVAKVVLNNAYEYDDEYETEPPCSTSYSYSSSYSTIVFLRLKTIIVKGLETSLPAYAGKRKVLLKGSRVRQHFLLSPQSSALSPYLS
jgi:hypothetical protein